jgi:hypothetical protein
MEITSFPRGSVTGAVVDQLSGKVTESHFAKVLGVRMVWHQPDVPRKSTGQTSLATDNIDEGIAARYTVSHTIEIESDHLAIGFQLLGYN